MRRVRMTIAALGKRIDARFKRADRRTWARFDAIDARFDAIDARFDRMDAAIERRFAQADRKVESLGAKLDRIAGILDDKYVHQQKALDEHQKRITDIEHAREGKTRPARRCWNQSIWQRRRRLREKYASIAPPKPRRRIREARRWLDVLAVRCTNGRVCERQPGERHISFRESAEIHTRGLRELEATDPELFRSVRWIMWSLGAEDLDTTYEEWQHRSWLRSRHLSKVRAEVQRSQDRSDRAHRVY